MANRYANLVGSNKIKDEYTKINTGFDKVEEEIDAHVGAGGNAHATATTSSAGFMSAADKQKLDGIEEGAQVNQNAYAKVNGMEADDPSDEVVFEGGTGITVTQNPNEKKVIITATGEATPGPHGSSHLEHGSDPIPYATVTDGGLMSAEDKQSLEALEGLPQEVTELKAEIATELASIGIRPEWYRQDTDIDDTRAIRLARDVAALHKTHVRFTAGKTYVISGDIGNVDGNTACNYLGEVSAFSRFADGNPATIKVTHTDAPALTIRSNQVVGNLRFLYEHEDIENPTPYPATILVKGHSGHFYNLSFKDCYIAFEFADQPQSWVGHGGFIAENISICGFYRGFLIDFTTEISWLKNIIMTTSTTGGNDYRDANFIGIESKRVDGLYMDNVFQFGGLRFVNKIPGSTGNGLTHYLNNCRCESVLQPLNLVAGTRFLITNSSFAKRVGGARNVQITNVSVLATNSVFQNTTDGSSPTQNVMVSGATVPILVKFSNCEFFEHGGTKHGVHIHHNAGSVAKLSVIGCDFKDGYAAVRVDGTGADGYIVTNNVAEGTTNGFQDISAGANKIFEDNLIIA